MLYCSDCDKDVEFKSLDVGGKLTHFCPDCGESNLFKSKDEFQAGVDLLIETKKRRDKIRDGIIQPVIALILILSIFFLIAFVTRIR